MKIHAASTVAAAVVALLAVGCSHTIGECIGFSSAPRTVQVTVTGNVARAGMYKLPRHSTIADAVRAAGDACYTDEWNPYWAIVTSRPSGGQKIEKRALFKNWSSTPVSDGDVINIPLVRI
jgi:protein involved in polysaccharide export with SLBB domain